MHLISNYLVPVALIATMSSIKRRCRRLLPVDLQPDATFSIPGPLAGRGLRPAAGGQWRPVWRSLSFAEGLGRGPAGGDKKVWHAHATPRLPQGIASLPRGGSPVGRQRQPGRFGPATRRSRPSAHLFQRSDLPDQARQREPHGSRVVGNGAAGCPCRESVDHPRVCRRPASSQSWTKSTKYSTVPRM